jgi:hypothetical protein
VLANKLITYEKAKKRIEELQNYIDLIDRYETNTLEKWIIKQYALTNSMKKITEIAEAEGITVDGAPLEQKHISSVIRGKGEKGDELHRILRSGYRRRVRPRKIPDRRPYIYF